MKPPIELVPMIDVQEPLVPSYIKDQIMGLREHNGEFRRWVVGEIADYVAKNGDDHRLVSVDDEIVDHEAIDTYLRSLGVEDGYTINFHIWW